ncbi:hypothetical protein [Winogradskyella immobilis]|uniref:DKNYY family protein n=1 Tax=Winogradskyella immobilis TaxID=2816852 RepID=A0ABS8EP35_9FLAO|nr:hypothetical protein [Winogradskyella immobilis]MCC1484787.1 hypothetical protein [Winogradskyella immobilis]MCG0016879.1 hypothetical protein [Winogradskyella immobilis]
MKLNKQYFDLTKESNATLNDWVNYYQNSEPNFSLNKFEFKSNDTLQIIQGNIFGIFDSNFDQIYSDFLIYKNDKEKYIDFDSYSWVLNEKKEILFSPDQEINVVDIKNKTINRIAFRGPSQWVENIFWQNDSTVVLLENNHEKQPTITKINLAKKTIRTFIYQNHLTFVSEHSKWRFDKLGLKYK